MSRTQTELRLNNGQIEERLMLPLALSYDHRVINGADAARFVATLCGMLSDPFQLLSAI
jgi:pyruvate dehydrogenase E2 component (dihydrolipoamide acetyltransferase)